MTRVVLDADKGWYPLDTNKHRRTTAINRTASPLDTGHRQATDLHISLGAKVRVKVLSIDDASCIVTLVAR
ncbi:MAG: hypothetical protein PVF46_03030 [Lysobacterales bacterium]|jgi:hypothetical protein